MKKLSSLVFLLFICLHFKASAQENLISEINYNLLEKYIQSAKENFPRQKIFTIKTESAHTAIPMNAVSYLDFVGVSYIYRPNDNTAIVPTGATNANPYAVNGFQFGFNISLGSYLQKPFIGRKARLDYNVAQLEAQEYTTTLTLEVKKRYYTYIQQINQLKINSQSVDDNRNVADNLKYKFEKGEITLDVYNQSRINLANANTSKLQAEFNYLVAKDNLEEIIGKSLSEIK